MFTGIITDKGSVLNVEEAPQGRIFKIATHYDTSTIDIGASIAHNGVCMTVIEKSTPNETPAWYVVEAWSEALKLSNVGVWQDGTSINLERSLKMGDELGGHQVSGHVDDTAEVIGKQAEGDAIRFTLRAPKHLAKFINPKGSATLNGTSLTVNEVNDTDFDILIIRHTLDVTTWGETEIGDQINLEVDQFARTIARYVEQYLSQTQKA